MRSTWGTTFHFKPLRVYFLRHTCFLDPISKSLTTKEESWQQMAPIDSSTSKLFFCYLLLILLPISSSYSNVFESWCKEHGKTYASEAEKLRRYRVFEDNLAFVTRHNAMANSTYTLSLNVFADLTHYEFKATRLGISSAALASAPRQVLARSLAADVPASLDWRNKDAVTPVKDQGSCGTFGMGFDVCFFFLPFFFPLSFDWNRPWLLVEIMEWRFHV